MASAPRRTPCSCSFDAPLSLPSRNRNISVVPRQVFGRQWSEEQNLSGGGLPPNLADGISLAEALPLTTPGRGMSRL
jgi:hypothetical protein